MERLQATFDKLLRETTSKFHRYMYDRIDWQARVVGLLGPRGVGKTTMVLQYIKENLPRKETLYVVAEDLYFSSHTLIDLADAFARIGGKHLFIDEIHKYKGWSRELKLIYDYHSELHVFFTGSSVLDISKGVADLSRRVLTFEMQGLSYREYLSLFHHIELPTYTLQQILSQEVVLPKGFLPIQHFADYLKRGYYPFRDDNFERYIMQVVNTTRACWLSSPRRHLSSRTSPRLAGSWRSRATTLPTCAHGWRKPDSLANFVTALAAYKGLGKWIKFISTIQH